MTILTLLTKIYSPRQLKQADEELKTEFENLELDFKVLGAPINKWMQVSLSGEDEVIATNYLNREIGTCPVSIKKIQKDQTLNGFITNVDTENNQLTVDVGVFEPKNILSNLSLVSLQNQLTEGKQESLMRISETYGLEKYMPIKVKVTELDFDKNTFKVELSEAQIEKIHLWQQSLLDRLIVLGTTKKELEVVIERAQLDRDIIDIETLGFFEHALVCKLGTDAAGLIPNIGRYLRHAQIVIFKPQTQR